MALCASWVNCISKGEIKLRMSTADGASENFGLYERSDGLPATPYHLSKQVEDNVDALAKEYKEEARAHHKGAIVKASKRLLAKRWLERALPMPPSKSPAMGGYRKHAMRGDALRRVVQYQREMRAVAQTEARMDAMAKVVVSRCVRLAVEGAEQCAAQATEVAAPAPTDDAPPTTGRKRKAALVAPLEAKMPKAHLSVDADEPKHEMTVAAERFEQLVESLGGNESAAVLSEKVLNDPILFNLVQIFETFRPASAPRPLLLHYQQKPLMVEGDVVHLTWTVANDESESLACELIHVDTQTPIHGCSIEWTRGKPVAGSKELTLPELGDGACVGGDYVLEVSLKGKKFEVTFTNVSWMMSLTNDKLIEAVPSSWQCQPRPAANSAAPNADANADAPELADANAPELADANAPVANADAPTTDADAPMADADAPGADARAGNADAPAESEPNGQPQLAHDDSAAAAPGLSHPARS